MRDGLTVLITTQIVGTLDSGVRKVAEDEDAIVLICEACVMSAKQVKHVAQASIVSDLG